MDALDLWRGRRSQRSLLNNVFEMINELEQSAHNKGGHPMQTRTNTFAPACDVTEAESSYLLSFDVPGLKKDNIDIEVKGDQLTVSGERKKEEDFAKNGFHRSERSFGEFSRTFTLPEGTNADFIDASYEEGVLTIAIPKVEEKKPLKIQVKSGSKSFLKKVANKTEAQAVNQ